LANLQEFKCPCCGGAVEFNSKLQKMKCPYCDTEYDMETVKEVMNEETEEASDQMEWNTTAGSAWQNGEAGDLVSYICKSCGGEIVCDRTTAATACPYCDNPVVMQEHFAGMLRPDCVIPFKLDKKAAKEAYQNHLKGKVLLPGAFKDKNHIDEIKGVYVPFWLFDAEAEAKVRYRATRVRTWSDSNYEYTETRYYRVLREGNLGFEHVPVDGSTKMADDLMESIEPFDFSEAVDFQTAYLSGFLADRYDVDAEQSIERANERIKKSTESAFADTVHGYSSVIPESSSVRLSEGKSKYALYPVWLLNTTYQNEKYTFAMNGQTGKFVGNLPVDKKKYWFFFGAGTAVISALVSLLMMLF
jgi:DNA-directed RNA polymerase subunit RPC12/RpoP